MSSLQHFADFVPHLVGALLILIVGWIIAVVVRALLRKGLHALGVNKRIEGHAPTLNIERITAGVVFWIIILFTLIGVFNVLQINEVSSPLHALADKIMLYLPRVLLAAALGVIAWVVATLVRKFASKGLAATGMDKKLAPPEGTQAKPMSETLGNVFFWLIILLFLPAIVGALEMSGLLAPLQNMVHKLLAFVPNIIAALFIGGIGYLIAKVLREVVTGLLAATRVDTLAKGKDGKSGVQISRLGGTLVFLFVFVPALIAALQALKIHVIADPAQHMLQLLLNAVPNIIAAGVILVIAWFIGRFIADMLTQLLGQMGFDRLPAHLGFKPASGEAAAADGTSHLTPSAIVGKIALWFVMAFAVMEAAHRLNFTGIDALFEQLIKFASQIAFGLLILAVGQWLASMAAKAIRRTSSDYSLVLSRIARIAILGLVVAMGLHAMGFSYAITDLAFGLTLGSVAVAVALAFGLGGRDAAGRVARHWVDGYLKNKDE